MKAHLTVSTYSGMCPDASHWMGRLRLEGSKDDINVEYELTVSQAKTMNRDNRENGDDYRYKPGSISTRFFTEEELVTDAIALATKLGVTLLFKGSHCILDPQPVLIGPEPLKTQLNALVAEAEANDWWEGDEATMEDISKRWEALL